MESELTWKGMNFYKWIYTLFWGHIMVLHNYTVILEQTATFIPTRPSLRYWWSNDLRLYRLFTMCHNLAVGFSWFKHEFNLQYHVTLGVTWEFFCTDHSDKKEVRSLCFASTTVETFFCGDGDVKNVMSHHVDRNKNFSEVRKTFVSFLVIRTLVYCIKKALVTMIPLYEMFPQQTDH